MNRIAMLLIPCLGVWAAVTTVGDTSNAAISPMAGLAQSPGEDTCFANSNGTITNVCGGVRRYCVAVNVTSSGNKSVAVTALRPNGGTLACHATAVNRFGGAVSGTGNVPLNVVNVDTAFTVGTVNVPAFGAAFACCDLSTSARIDTVNFTN